MSTFTPAQQSAIRARGNVLVVAGAGTGKTRTLIERCLQLLREGVSLDQMLLVTFTEAAAAEMRARLRGALEVELQAEQGRTGAHADRLAEELALLDAAQISTLHSFCLRLVREHFHALEIDPQLVILDERQTRPLARDCLAALFAEHYGGRHAHSAVVQQLIRSAGRGSDEHLRTLVWKLHCYAQSLPDPDGWFTAQLAMFREEAPTQWRAWFATGFEEWRAEWLAALACAPDVPALTRSRAALAGLDSVEPHAERGSARADSVGGWGLTESRPTMSRMAEALAAVLAADDTKLWSKKKTELRPAFAKLFEEAEFLLSIVGDDGSGTALAEDWEWSRHAMAALVQLARQFGVRFGEAKRQLGGLDFADLEQFALRLLRDEATGVARQCRVQFAHVCVDEYQDINAAQDAILRLVSGDEGQGNRFLVGDLKQSIYRFRLANPRIFAAYAKAWRVGAPASGPALSSELAQRAGSETGAPSVIALSDNFRSREAILNFVNPLFRVLMRESIGGVTYDAEAELKFGNPEGRAMLRDVIPLSPIGGEGRGEGAPSEVPQLTTNTARVELHILTNDTDEQSEDSDAPNELLDLLAVEREARCVALRLRELNERGHEVWDDEAKALRPVQWRDMVVLMRSPGSRVESFAQEFHRAGVPLQAERGGFYSALEVSDLLNLLRLLDNPLQDLPLLAVLRSPLVAMSLEDLVTIRTHNPERLLWDALTKFRAGGVAAGILPAVEPGVPPGGEVVDGLETLLVSSAEPDGKMPSSTAGGTPAATQTDWTKADWFLTRFAVWRERIRLGSLTECLEGVLTETHYESLLLVEPRGAERVANVRRLLDLARQFAPYQGQGLHRFLHFIDAQTDSDLDHAFAPAQTDNAVRLMSIHQSKGLEFPVVLVAGLGTMFNERDLRGDILLDEEFGLCPMVIPPGSDRRYESLPHWLARRRGRRELLGEEMRLLYVALTRARDTLVLVGTDTGKSVAEKWRWPASELNERTLLKARRPLDWLRAWLPTVTAEAEWSGDAGGQNGLLSWSLYAADDERLASGGVARPLTSILRSNAMEDRPARSPSGGEGEDAAANAKRLEASRDVDDELVASLRAKLTRPYPHVPATHEPAKTSVTVLRRRAAAAEEEVTPWFRPRGADGWQGRGGLSAAQAGLAHHAFLQCVDLARTATALDLRNEAARLVSEGVLSERDAKALDFAALLTFWESSVGQQVRANARMVQREIPFTARFTVRELEAMDLMGTASGGSGGEMAPAAETQNRRLLTSSPTGEREEFVIVQGVADLVVFGEREIWLLDYKTDHFDEAEVAAKAREHGPQLTLYALALERIYGKKVTRTWLHFLALGRTELL